jgi:adenylate kinase
MKIVITGSPGTGKTTISKLLSKQLKLEFISIKEHVEQNNLCEGEDCEVDISKLSKSLEFLEEKNDYVIEGHLACEQEIPADFVFVLRANPEVLRDRLSERNYNPEKLRENIMAEILDYCTQRSQASYTVPLLELDTSSKTPQECADAIADAIKLNKKKLDDVDYSDSLSRLLGAGPSTIDIHEGNSK